MRSFCVCMEQFESRTLLSAGAVDPTYAPTYVPDLPVSFSSKIRAQIDGKMLHYSDVGYDSYQLWRTNPDGSLDRSFGSHGIIDLGSISNGAMEIRDFEVQSNGKFVALMGTDDKSIQLRRFNANGKPDTSFGVGGKSILSTPAHNYFNSMTIQNDGKIIVAGNDDVNGYIRRFDIHGTADPSFGTNGVVTITPTYDHGFGWIMMGGIDIRRSDNRIVFSYTDAAHGGIFQWYVEVLAPNGHWEWTTPGAPMANDGSNTGDIVLDGDGSILASGTAELTDPDGGDSDHTILVRYPPPKSSAKESWIDVTDQGVGQMIPQPGGRLLITSGGRIRRLNYNLSPDTSFGAGGSVNIDLDSFVMAVGGDGKIVVDGGKIISPPNPDSEFHSIRLTGDKPFAVASGKFLNISGTANGERITVGKSAGIISVSINGFDPYLFSAKRIKKLFIDAGAGDDTIRLGKSVPLASINGGDGNDTLIGKRRKDKTTSVEHLA